MRVPPSKLLRLIHARLLAKELQLALRHRLEQPRKTKTKKVGHVEFQKKTRNRYRYFDRFSQTNKKTGGAAGVRVVRARAQGGGGGRVAVLGAMNTDEKNMNTDEKTREESV